MSVDPTQLEHRFNEHRLDYERRHGALSERVAKMETAIANLATKDDLAKLKAEIIASLSDMIATRTDVDWLKRAYWVSVGAVSTVLTIIVGLLISHVATQKP